MSRFPRLLPSVLASEKISDLTFLGYAKAVLLFFGHVYPHKTIQSPVENGEIWKPNSMAQLKALFKCNTGAKHPFLQCHRAVASIHP